MDAIIAQLQDLVEGQIDFEGQKVTELISTIVLTVFTILAMGIGFVQGDIYLTMWIELLGVVLTLLVVVPPWPFFNQHPQPWLGSKAKMKLPRGGITIQSAKAS